MTVRRIALAVREGQDVRMYDTDIMLTDSYMQM